MGGRNFLLRCNYDTKYFNDLPVFYKKILQFFNDLRLLHVYDQQQDIMLFNNKEILVDGKPIFFIDGSKRALSRLKIYSMKIVTSYHLTSFPLNTRVKPTFYNITK